MERIWMLWRMCAVVLGCLSLSVAAPTGWEVRKVGYDIWGSFHRGVDTKAGARNAGEDAYALLLWYWPCLSPVFLYYISRSFQKAWSGLFHRNWRWNGCISNLVAYEWIIYRYSILPAFDMHESEGSGLVSSIKQEHLYNNQDWCSQSTRFPVK